MSDVKATARMAVPDHVSRLARLRMSSFGLVAMLIIQFILGVIYNLYGTAPAAGAQAFRHPSAIASAQAIATAGRTMRHVSTRSKRATARCYPS